VRAYLVEHGVAAEILEAEGIGENRPIADNDSPEGRERNRRVELHVTEVAGAGSDAAGAP
jgi:outer membrane protein OmpA-like peptidoglycan-associated protein